MLADRPQRGDDESARHHQEGYEVLAVVECNWIHVRLLFSAVEVGIVETHRPRCREDI